MKADIGDGDSTECEIRATDGDVTSLNPTTDHITVTVTVFKLRYDAELQDISIDAASSRRSIGSKFWLPSSPTFMLVSGGLFRHSIVRMDLGLTDAEV